MAWTPAAWAADTTISSVTSSRKRAMLSRTVPGKSSVSCGR